MEIYEVNGLYYKDLGNAENIFKLKAREYFTANPLDECDLENLPCGGKQYVADRYLKKSNAIIVSKIKIINVI